MTYKIVTSENSAERYVHSGRTARITDGHLEILDADDKVAAIFASGTWKWAIREKWESDDQPGR